MPSAIRLPAQLLSECLRVNMTVDQVVLWQTDEAAEARGLTRSAFIESGLATVIDGRNRRTSMAATHLAPSGSTNDHSRK